MLEDVLPQVSGDLAVKCTAHPGSQYAAIREDLLVVPMVRRPDECPAVAFAEPLEVTKRGRHYRPSSPWRISSSSRESAILST